VQVLRSEAYTKRMNLSSDPARASCWAAHIRSPSVDVGVIGVRREYVPPAGDSSQDAFVMLVRKADNEVPHDAAEERRIGIA
jgi:hypothetical protein